MLGVLKMFCRLTRLVARKKYSKSKRRSTTRQCRLDSENTSRCWRRCLCAYLCSTICLCSATLRFAVALFARARDEDQENRKVVIACYFSG